MFEINGLAFTEDQVLSGDSILVKRAVLERIGVMDTQFFGYFGDVDFGLRCHLAGFKLICAKGAWLRHEGAGHIKTEADRTKRGFGAVQSDAHAARRRRLYVISPEMGRQFASQIRRQQPASFLPDRREKEGGDRIEMRYLPAELRTSYDITVI